jgi:hypothetical protein
MGDVQCRGDDAHAVPSSLSPVPVVERLLLQCRRVPPPKPATTFVLARGRISKFNERVIHQLLLVGRTVGYLGRIGETGGARSYSQLRGAVWGKPTRSMAPRQALRHQLRQERSRPVLDRI